MKLPVIAYDLHPASQKYIAQARARSCVIDDELNLLSLARSVNGTALHPPSVDFQLLKRFVKGGLIYHHFGVVSAPERLFG